MPQGSGYACESTATTSQTRETFPGRTAAGKQFFCHYASKWVVPAEAQRNDLALVNQLGYDYALLPDGPDKEAQLLLLLEKFHGFLMKYLTMIVKGTLPPANTRAGKDSKNLLWTLAPKKSGIKTPEQVRKMMHLAETARGQFTRTGLIAIRDLRRTGSQSGRSRVLLSSVCSRGNARWSGRRRAPEGTGSARVHRRSRGRALHRFA